MKEQLRQVYELVSSGRISQREALETIKAMKTIGVLWAAPLWQAGDDDADAGVETSERHIFDFRDADIAERYTEHALACFERIRTILRGSPQGNVLVQVVVADDGQHALLAGLSGLLETAARENPQLVGQLILVPAETGAAELERLLEEERRRAPEPQVKYSASGRQVLRWQELTADPEPPPVAFKDHGVYLITGGLGALGILFAKEILNRTREARVILTGRSPQRPVPDALSYRQLDLGDLEQVTRLVASIQEEHGRLDGILHCAGMVADNFILKKSADEFSRVLAPKVTGTLNLDSASRGVELDFFVLFSSVVGAMGNVGQADYAAANAFMDRFAAYRNGLVTAGQRHGRTRSINWPVWNEGGIGTDAAARELLRQATGLQPMRTATGMDAFHRAVAWPYDQLLVAEGDLTQIRRALRNGRPAEPRRAVVPAMAGSIDEHDLAEKTEEYLRRESAEVLKLPLETIDSQAELARYGIDSILAMKLTNHLEKTFGTLPKTLFFEHQTIWDLTGYFVRSHSARLATLFPATSGVDAPPEPPAPARSKRGRRSGRPAGDNGKESVKEPIAIVGLSGRYPEAVDVEAYWRNLREGKDCIVEVPKERWDWREYYSQDRTEDGRHYSKWGGFIAGVDEFDPLFFNNPALDTRRARAVIEGMTGG